jgi:hypothetical protein
MKIYVFKLQPSGSFSNYKPFLILADSLKEANAKVIIEKPWDDSAECIGHIDIIREG